MKYIDAEKLIAEIERMRKINRKALESDHIVPEVFHGRAQTLNHLFEFIDSLQQEQQEVDLEEEAVMFCFDNGINITPGQAKEIACHFWNKGYNARKEE